MINPFRYGNIVRVLQVDAVPPRKGTTGHVVRNWRHGPPRKGTTGHVVRELVLWIRIRIRIWIVSGFRRAKLTTVDKFHLSGC